jgi:hypothetical protein
LDFVHIDYSTAASHSSQPIMQGGTATIGRGAIGLMGSGKSTLKNDPIFVRIMNDEIIFSSEISSISEES